LGRGYELLMAEKTNKLDPPHKGVPWITIDGKHTADIQTKAENQLLKLVCDTYTVSNERNSWQNFTFIE